MYEEHIRAAARSMAENMQRSPVPMYGKGLRLPDKGAVIGLLKEIRRLVFPAYYGDPELMTLPVEDYTALLLERIEGQLARQIALALPEEQEQRACDDCAVDRVRGCVGHGCSLSLVRRTGRLRRVG